MSARKVPPGTYDIAGPDLLSFEELTETVADLVVDDNALTSVFGVEPTPFRQAAEKAING